MKGYCNFMQHKHVCEQGVYGKEFTMKKHLLLF